MTTTYATTATKAQIAKLRKQECGICVDANHTDAAHYATASSAKVVTYGCADHTDLIETLRGTDGVLDPADVIAAAQAYAQAA